AYPKTEVEAVELQVNASRGTSASSGKPGEEDLFKFSADRAGRYIISTRGSTDGIMKLCGPDRQTQLIAEDDDSGVGTNARIVSDLIPGVYYMQIRHYYKATGTGDYTVRVRRA
ncbi:MAG: peptidase, partial [Burkholderiales bacterium]